MKQTVLKGGSQKNTEWPECSQKVLCDASKFCCKPAWKPFGEIEGEQMFWLD